ncbi:MAG: DNA repair protein RecO C-terminal domain-containing protein [Pseudomonadota bacterium]
MDWSDEAIVLDVGVDGDRRTLTMLTKDHGRCACTVTKPNAKKKEISIGSILNITFSGTGLGDTGGASIQSATTGLPSEDDDLNENSLHSINGLIEMHIPASEPLQDVFVETKKLLASLASRDGRWPVHYFRVEFAILDAAGLAPDLKKRSAAFQRGEQIYVSPRTSKVISQTEAGAYIGQCAPVPGFLMGKKSAKHAEIQQAAELLNQMMRASDNEADPVECWPIERQRLIEKLKTVVDIPNEKPKRPPKTTLTDTDRRRLLMTMRPLSVSVGRSYN